MLNNVLFYLCENAAIHQGEHSSLPLTTRLAKKERKTRKRKRKTHLCLGDDGDVAATASDTHAGWWREPPPQSYSSPPHLGPPPTLLQRQYGALKYVNSMIYIDSDHRDLMAKNR